VGGGVSAVAIARRERSLVVFLSFLLGGMVLVFSLGEFFESVFAR